MTSLSLFTPSPTVMSCRMNPSAIFCFIKPHLMLLYSCLGTLIRHIGHRRRYSHPSQKLTFSLGDSAYLGNYFRLVLSQLWAYTVCIENMHSDRTTTRNWCWAVNKNIRFHVPWARPRIWLASVYVCMYVCYWRYRCVNIKQMQIHRDTLNS